MTETAAAPGMQLTTVDGMPLKQALVRARRRGRRRAFLLVAPLLLFILVSFVLPMGQMLFRSIHNPSFPDNMPQITAWFKANDSGTAPDEAAFAALVEDLRNSAAARTIGTVGTRVNYEMAGTRSLFTSTGRKAAKLEPPFAESLAAVDEKWVAPKLWAAMRTASAAISPDFYIAAMDRTRDNDGKIIQVPPQQQIYLKLFGRTLVISVAITLICLMLGFPVAHLLATLPMKQSNLLMILVLLPFWTSLLVRTTAWIAILQGQGVINSALVALGVLSEGGRLEMMYNRTGTIIAMVHILLPFVILPLYSVMRSINPSYARAARSLGATSWTTFRRIYLPLTLPGMGAGAILVFILAVGYYITPALVGGASGQLISNMIAFHMQNSLNWSLAAALAAMLLAAVLLLYWLYDRLVGVDNMKLG